MSVHQKGFLFVALEEQKLVVNSGSLDDLLVLEFEVQRMLVALLMAVTMLVDLALLVLLLALRLARSLVMEKDEALTRGHSLEMVVLVLRERRLLASLKGHQLEELELADLLVVK